MAVKPAFLVLVLLSLTSPARAASLSLAEAVEEARHNSPKLQKSQSALEEAQWKRVETYSGFLPSLSLSANRLLDKDYLLTDVKLAGSPAPVAIPQIVPSTILSLNGQLPLFDGFASTNRFLSARSFEAAAGEDLAWQGFLLEREVVLLYYKALGAEALRKVAEQNLRTLEDHSRDTGLLKKAGVSTNYDLLRVDVQVSEARSELMNAEDNQVLAKNRLAEAMGKAFEERDISGSLPVLEESLIAGLDTQAPSERGDLKAMGERVEGASRLESAASTHLVPRLSLFGQYQYYNNRNDELTDGAAFRHAHQVGLALNWNIFDGMSSISRSKQSVEQRVQMEKQYELARLHSRQDLELWKRKFLYFCSVYKARVSDVEKAKESLRLAREGRRAGARTNTDILDAESDLFRAEAGVVNSQIGAIESLLNLEQAAGKPIHKFF
jgi:outer membrane protein TolC